MMAKYYYSKNGNRRYLTPVGRPKTGFRWHWLIWMLPRVTMDKYSITASRSMDAYKLVYKDSSYKQKRIDEYTIIRTSPKCYRVMYYDKPSGLWDYTSYKTAHDVVDYIIYRLQKKIKQENHYLEELALRKQKK